MNIYRNLKICSSFCFFAVAALFLCEIKSFAQPVEEDMKKAEFLSGSRKNEDAIKLYKKIASKVKDPEVKKKINEKIAENYVFTTLDKEESEKNKIFEMILKKYPDTKIAYCYCLDVPDYFFKTGKYKKAIQYYQKVIERYPKDDKAKKALSKISEIQLKRGQHKDAIRTARQLADEYPESFKGLFDQLHVAEEYYKDEQFQKALKTCFEIFDYMKNDSKRIKFKIGIYNLMTEIYLKMGQIGKAWETVLQKEQEFPAEADSPFWRRKVANYFRIIDKNYPAALKIYEDLYKKFPQDIIIPSNLAQLYERLGQYENAIKFYFKDLDLEPEDKSIPPYTRISLMNCYMKTGNFDKAKEQGNIILELFPENKEAKECLEQIRQQQK